MKGTIAILVLACGCWQIDAGAVVATGRVLNEDGLDKWEELCIIELNLDREKIVKLNKQDNLGTGADEDIYNWTACSLKKMGLMNEDGEIDYGQLEKYILEATKSKRPEDPIMSKFFEITLSTTIEECSKGRPAGTNHGENAIEIMSCITYGMQAGYFG